MTQSRTLEHPSSRVSIAVHALFAQGRYGVVTELARTHGLRRQEVYDLRERARVALEQAVVPSPPSSVERPSPGVSDAHVQRAMVALRVVTPASMRDIEEVLPVLFGIRYSHGKVWNVLHEAEQRAAAFNRTVDLARIGTLALDEMFSQGQPVFAGIDPDTGYLALLEPHDSRSGEQWAAVLGRCRDQQRLMPQRVVKDAGSGLGLGVKLAWPGVDEHDDLFHASWMLGKQQQRLERAAYAEIEAVEELVRKRAAAGRASVGQRRSLGQQLRAARARAEQLVERHDRYEVLQRRALSALELTERGSGRLRTRQEVVAELVSVAEGLRQLGGQQVGRVASYLANRAEGLGKYLDELDQRLRPITKKLGKPLVEAAVRAYQASLAVERGGPWFERRARKQELNDAVRQLLHVSRRDPESLRLAFAGVLPVLARRHRASSVIENLNSVLRPYLVVQKHAQPGFLELFRFYWNTRRRRWGRFAGTSAHELLTGKPVNDWLTLLGFPPSTPAAKAAA